MNQISDQIMPIPPVTINTQCQLNSPDPDQQRREESQTHKLPRGIKPDGGSALVLREPAGHHAVVGREGWRFEDAGNGA